jgi:transposase
LALQHFYRTVAFLAGVRQELESKLFTRDLNLFNQTLDVVCIDTTSLYMYRDSETEWRKRGYSRDHRPDLPQWVLCVAVKASGWPIAWEIFPGTTADQEAMRKIVDTLRSRFHIGKVTVVADRGMISQDTIKLLTEHDRAPFDYVLGGRMRRQKEVSEAVLARAGRYQAVAPNLEVKEVQVGERRYVVCRNPLEAQKMLPCETQSWRSSRDWWKNKAPRPSSATAAMPVFSRCPGAALPSMKKRSRGMPGWMANSS